jgi:hypothetical protein
VALDLRPVLVSPVRTSPRISEVFWYVARLSCATLRGVSVPRAASSTSESPVDERPLKGTHIAFDHGKQHDLVGDFLTLTPLVPIEKIVNNAGAAEFASWFIVRAWVCVIVVKVV